MAETCTLTLKRRETKSAVFDRASYMYWSVQPQYFFVQMTAQGKGQSRPVGPATRRWMLSSGSSRRSPSTSPSIRSAAWSSSARKNTPSLWTWRPRRRKPKAKKPDAKETPAKPNDSGGKRQASALWQAAGGSRRRKAAGQAGVPAQGFLLQPALFRFQSQRRPDRRQGH